MDSFTRGVKNNMQNDKKSLIQRYLKAVNIDTKIQSLKDIELLIQRHLLNFSFTNIPVLLKEDISLEISEIVQKIVITKRGGYCFEHNKLIYKALLDAGFEVKAFLGRVLNNQNIEVPKTHRLSILTYENDKYLIDVGFGFSSPNTLIKFKGVTTTSLGVSYRVQKRAQNSFALQIVLENSFYTLYSFELNDYNEADCELGHFYSHKHPKANFVNNLVISRILENETRSLRNGNYQKIFKETKEEININSAQELEEILLKEFEYPIVHSEGIKLYEAFCK